MSDEWTSGVPRGRGVGLTAVLCVLVLAAGLVTAAYELGTASVRPATQTTSAAGDGDAADTEALLEDELAPVAELYDELTAEAVEVPDPDVLVEGALQGMVEALDDPYASFYDAAEFSDFNEVLDGTFTGVGLLLEEKPEGVFVVTVIDEAPAAEAGVEEGERIVSVDGEDVTDAPIEHIVKIVRGEAGSDVVLGLEGGSAGPRDVSITRGEVDLPLVEHELLDSGAGYVQLWQFSDNAGEAVREAVADLVDEGADGIVLDLRGNPGGLLQEAVSVASVFIESGPIVGVQERAGEREVLHASGGAFAEVPLVVLVDDGSASASEIVAGAVQDAERGPLIGEPTFGKGTVQTIRTLTDGAGVKFTSANYFTPSGDSIEEAGVQPDRVVEGEQAQLAAAEEALNSLLAAAGR